MNDQIIRITRALNHPIRIQILYYLNDHKESSVNNLVKQFDVSQPAISRHLRILEEARLVKSKRVGTVRVAVKEKRGFSKDEITGNNSH